MLIPTNAYQGEDILHPTHISHPLERSMRNNNWFKQFNHEGCNVHWFKYLFTRHCPWVRNYNYEKCDEAWLNDHNEDKVGWDEYWDFAHAKLIDVLEERR